MKKKVLLRTEISPTIISEMKKSENEILVVSTCFTDEDLLNILIKKQEQGVKVKMIVEDNLENEKYRFFRLIKAGGEVYKIKMEDFGIMHKKYCIIDEKIAVFPLAIRSPYFLLNDHESLIVTDHRKTAQNLKTHFYKIRENATTISNNNIVNSILTRIKNLVAGIFKIKGQEAKTTKEIDFEKNIKPTKRINLKMINPASFFEDESGDIFLNRN